MLLSQILEIDHIKVKQNYEDKYDAIKEIVNLFSDSLNTEELNGVTEAVIQREKIMSTAVGQGVAIPHGKTKILNKHLVALVTLDTPLDYEALDDEEVKIIFLVVGPAFQNSEHIKILSRVSRLLNNSQQREKLLTCTTAEEVLEIIKQEDNL